MKLFLSTYTNKVDGKGRVSVPAPFRAVLAGAAFQGVVVFRSQAEPALEGFGQDDMADLAARLDSGFDLFSQRQDDLALAIFGESVPLALDGDGRVTLTQDLMDHAAITDKAVFVGMGRKFQIWAPERYRTRRESALQNVRDKGLSLPKNGGSL